METCTLKITVILGGDGFMSGRTPASAPEVVKYLRLLPKIWC